MSEWIVLCGDALWILGLAIVFSTLSYAHWLAREQGMSLRLALTSSVYHIPWDLSLLLLSTGFCLSARSLGERIYWALFACFYIILILWHHLACRDTE